ncbi:MAG: hypothetical protein LBM99_02325 [Bacillales bacterium]|jgi:hypothetical protein|nr:hypothetical protein [Bacillales bacterium]
MKKIKIKVQTNTILSVKCDICGMEIKAYNRIFKCPFCREQFYLVLDKENDSYKLIRYATEGLSFLNQKNWDKAKNIFNKLLKADFGSFAKIFAYFGLISAEYQVIYFKDNLLDDKMKTKDNMPSIYKNKHYLKALELSNEDEKSFLEEFAEGIDLKGEK